MNISICALLVVLVLCNPTWATDNNNHFCGYELLTNLDGRAYTIERVGEDAANKTIQLFIDRMMHDHNVRQFRLLFGHEMGEIIKTVQWYYSFETVGRINRNYSLPDSFRCIYGDGWNTRANQSSVTSEMDFITTKFYSFEFLDRLKDQIPSNVPLPIFIVNGSPTITVWCNFAKAVHNDVEYVITMLSIESDEDQYLIIQLKDKASDMPILM